MAADIYPFPTTSTATRPTLVHPDAPQVKVKRMAWSEANSEAIDAIAKHPTVYPTMAHDSTPPVDVFTLDHLLANPDNYFLGVYVDDSLVGFWMMLSRTEQVVESHTFLLESARGHVATVALPQALKYIFTSTPCMMLVGEVPACAPAARQVAVWAGFKSAHVKKGAWLKDGQSHDLDIMYLGILDWFFKGLTGDTIMRAKTLISLLAIRGWMGKAAHLHTFFTATLGDLTGGA